MDVKISTIILILLLKLFIYCKVIIQTLYFYNCCRGLLLLKRYILTKFAQVSCSLRLYFVLSVAKFLVNVLALYTNLFVNFSNSFFLPVA